jgi:hypothetical protein
MMLRDKLYRGHVRYQPKTDIVSKKPPSKSDPEAEGRMRTIPEWISTERLVCKNDPRTDFRTTELISGKSFPKLKLFPKRYFRN